MDICLQAEKSSWLTNEEIRQALHQSVEGQQFKKVLLIPPDFTRFHSNAGLITNIYYHYFVDKCEVDILPALGTHEKMTESECKEMFGDIPYEKFLYHDWRNDIVKIGEADKAYLESITENLWHEPVAFEVNKILMDESYDLIISIGQIVPHEVIGMANYSKNLLVGCGGKETIHKSHMIGAVYGMERMMGKDNTPVRKLLDYGLDRFLGHRPILFVLTVTTAPKNVIHTHGLFIGKGRDVYEAAVALSQEKNIDFVDKGIKKCIVYLEPKEFKSTWLGNKAVYRTRMAIADGGELIILAPGVNKFGEDPGIDKLIRKYGYRGRMKILELFKENVELRESMASAAHLIHGSSDGRFTISYAVSHITSEEIKSVGYQALDYDEVIKKYSPDILKTGWNRMPDGEEVFYIPNPALGLWIDKNRF
ncbi:MAG: DUF2088 domain-containing protein [Bacilli bacterium]|nr:DUF2088 domain-containing protein [Bacilli bacterium]